MFYIGQSARLSAVSVALVVPILLLVCLSRLIVARLLIPIVRGARRFPSCCSRTHIAWFMRRRRARLLGSGRS